MSQVMLLRLTVHLHLLIVNKLTCVKKKTNFLRKKMPLFEIMITAAMIGFFLHVAY